MYKSILNHFQSPIDDIESSQYKIMGELNKYTEKFRKYKLFPELLQLYHLDNMLKSLYVKYQPFNESLSKGLKAPVIDSSKSNIVENDSEQSDNAEVFELIKWTMTLVESAMEEGIAVYEFVHDHISIDAAEPVPSKKNEGYLIIPDYESRLLKIFEYYSPVYFSKKKSAKSLKTKLLMQISLNKVETSTLSTGINLIARYGQKKNAATYCCNINIDMPFKETVLPIAKSVLLGIINEK